MLGVSWLLILSQNLEQWEAVKKDAELIDVGEDSMDAI